MKISKVLFGIFFFLHFHVAFCQWQPISSPTTNNLVDICFLNDSVGFIISSNGQLLKTEDFGSTWTLSATLSGTFTSLCNVGSDTLFAGGNAVYRSDDGGNTWNLKANLGYVMRDMQFFNSKNGYFIKPDYDTCGWFTPVYHIFENYKAMQTTDYGATWVLQLYNLNSSSTFELVNNHTAYIAANYISIQHQCAGFPVNSSMKTNDLGFSWNTFSEPSLNSLISFLNDTVGYYLNPGSISKTIDGGNSITTTYNQVIFSDAKQLKFITEIDGYLLGTNHIYSTNSNGLGWTTEYTSASNLNYFYKTNSNWVFVVGNNGLILRKSYTQSQGTANVYSVSVNNDSLDFGNVPLNTKVVSTIKVKNTGNQLLNLAIKTLGAFQIGFSTANYTDSLSLGLNSLKDTTLYILFYPTQLQSYTDTIQLSADSLNTVNFLLHGVGFDGLAGIVSRDTSICKDTLLIGGNITIKAGKTLRICPGTKVIFLKNYFIRVYGRLIAKGDSANRIQFLAADTILKWEGITIKDSSFTDTTEFAFCNMLSKCNSSSVTVDYGNVIINHCTIENKKGSNSTTAIFLGYSTTPGLPRYTQISNTTIYNSGSGIFCLSCESATIESNVIHHCDIGIESFTLKKIVVTNNRIYSNNKAGISGKGNFEISKNKIYSNGGGMDINGVGIKIKNNEVYNNHSDLIGGIKFRSSGGGEIIQNVIFNNTAQLANGAGLSISPYASSTSPVFIANNTLANNLVGNTFNGNNFYAAAFPSYALDVKLFNNILYSKTDSSNNIRWLNAVTREVKYNCINQKDSLDTIGLNNFTFKPHFVQASDSLGYMPSLANWDWSLQVYSYCVNKGDSINTFFLLPTDYLGNPRIYMNNRVDIGAYEFQGQGTASIKNNKNESDFILFPNPAKDKLTCVLGNSTKLNFTYCIIDNLGREQLKGKVAQASFTLDISALLSGAYTFILRNEKGEVQKKIFIKD